MKAYSTARLGPATSWGDAPEPMDTGPIWGVRIDDEVTGLKVNVIRERDGETLTVEVSVLDPSDAHELRTEANFHRVQAHMEVRRA